LPKYSLKLMFSRKAILQPETKSKPSFLETQQRERKIAG
jgi:hypothetical protein